MCWAFNSRHKYRAASRKGGRKRRRKVRKQGKWWRERGRKEKIG